MTDQNQPKLTLEEELDILEAVYKVGKEKGLALLRPEQMKKLKDAGRMNTFTASPAVSKKSESSIKADDLLIFGIEDVVVDVLIKNGFYTREQWESKSEVLKVNLLRAYTFAMLGIELEDWALRVRLKARK